MVAAGISPRASGARLGTVTVNDCVADRPPGSVAVTVMSELPRANPATVTELPCEATDATASSDDAAAYVRVWPSGSLKYAETSITSVSATATVTGSMAPRAAGGRLGTVTENRACPCRPSGSEAVTVTDALPGATPLTVTVVPDRETVATERSEEVAV